MTPHNEAELGDIAKTVLMPGDPLRAKYIAENFLENAKLVNSVRNMLTYTGTYKGKEFTIFPSGMGMPSMGIYCYELFKFYNVENIIRIGTCGAYTEELNLLDTILVDNSFTPGNFSLVLTGDDEHISASSTLINRIILETAKLHNIEIVQGNTLCSEVFDYYCEFDKFFSLIPRDLNIIAPEMEAYALFSTAQLFNKNASCLLSVVDSHYKEQSVTSEQREKSLNDMIVIALDSGLKL
ncbi:MAG: purine-nucleoside phosphorylase [Clostridia bacterium]|nr:purine-nucleoside phosphorylase [Clostridia bacterium]